MAEFEQLDQAALDAVTRRTEHGRNQIRAVSAEYDERGHGIVIRLSNGVATTFPIAMLPGLETATPAELGIIEIEGAGFGLRVPALDVDLSIPRLFEDHLGAHHDRPSRLVTAAPTPPRANGRLGEAASEGDARPDR